MHSALHNSYTFWLRLQVTRIFETVIHIFTAPLFSDKPSTKTETANTHCTEEFYMYIYAKAEIRAEGLQPTVRTTSAPRK